MEVSGRTETGMQHDLQTDILCQPCHGDGENIPAEGYCETCNEHFCSSCLKVHRKQSATKNHVIKSKDKMPRVQVHSDPCLELCTIHKKEIVKFYCQEHDTVGCGDCMVLHHKSCRVELVPDVSGNYGNSRELENIKKKINQLQKDIMHSKREIRHNMKVAEETKAKIISEIKAFRKELNSNLDHVEAELIQEVEELNAKDVSMQTEFQATCETMENEIKDVQSKLQQYSDKINQLFVTAKLSQERLQSYQTSIKEIASKCEMQLCTFEPSKDLMAVKVKHVPLGILQKKKSVATNAHFVKELSVKDENERGGCWITGLGMISYDEIVLCDYTNGSLKIFDVKRNEIMHKYKYGALACWDVTVIDSETVATTIPIEGKLLFVSTKDGLSERYSLSVRKGCKGIDHHNGVLAVTFENPAAVQILNVTGTILHEVTDSSVLKYPSHISLSNDDKSIFVSDKGSSAVYELTLDGRLKNSFTCEGMKRPRGLAVTSDGTVVVCDEERSNYVYLIVPDTREILSVSVQDVQKPFSVLVCEEQNQVYISEDLSSFDGRISLKIFDF